MRQKKTEYGCSYEFIAELSGVPVSTIQKIFGGTTSSPRRRTIEALSRAFIHMSKYVLADSGSTGEVIGTSVLNMPFEEKTVDDYLALPDDVRVELIDGVFYDMASPTFDHQFIAASIYNVFRNYIDDNNGSCIPVIAPFDVWLDRDDKTMVRPDIMIICDRDKITKPRLNGEPDPVEYSFDDSVPAGIWNGDCKVDFGKIKKSWDFFLINESVIPKLNLENTAFLW